MAFVSWQFFAFLAVLLPCYFLCKKKYQWIVLLVANYVFYMWADIKLTVFIIFTTVTVYYGGRVIDKINTKYRLLRQKTDITKEEKKLIKERNVKEKRRAVAVVLIINFGIWIFLKYGYFLGSNINALLDSMSLGCKLPLKSFALPLGISFYTFQAASYLIDVYRGKYKSADNLFKFALFLSFFPHIIQGPFSRFDILGKTLFEEHSFSYDRLCIGARGMLWGFFKKIVIADQIGIAVANIFDTPVKYDGIYIALAAVFFAVQVYADFSGYMDIASGISFVMGIELQQNFRQPYFSKSIEEFWRRWHITLGAWFKDYLFYPISMSKAAQKFGRKCRKVLGNKTGKLIPSYFALIFVWTATGLWHGANWTFLVWGLLNLFIIMFSMQMESTYKAVKDKLHISESNKVFNCFRIVRTFILVCFLRFLSRADSMSAAVSMYKSMFRKWKFSIFSDCELVFPGLSRYNIYAMLLGIILMVAVDFAAEKGCNRYTLDKWPCPVRYVSYSCLIFMIMLFAGLGSDMVGGFIYAKF